MSGLIFVGWVELGETHRLPSKHEIVMSNQKAYRASILHSIADPAVVGIEQSYEYFEDGLLVVENGHIVRVGHAADLLPSLNGVEITEYRDALITPGFIDTHIHYPQTGMIASYGEQLLDWLNTYTFPTEQQFADKAHASDVAGIFLKELLRNGTTTALVFGSVHKQSVDAFFEAAEALNLRMIAGKVLMDRNAPDYLTDTAESGYADSKELIERWHGKGRLHYAVTPRFAPTSTPEQLTLAGKLLGEYPNLYMHTHLSENLKEIEWVKALFPERKGYLDVYDHYQLIGARSVFAHGVHLCDDECKRLAETGSAVAFCPTSNLFLGSGLFDLNKLEDHGVRVGLGTDVGAGTSFSQLQSLNEAYKVMQLQGKKLDPFKSLYLATLGGANALYLDDKLGNFESGKDADFVVLDYNATPLISYRMQQAKTLDEKLFALTMLGDDRAVKETFAAGQSVHRRD
jgi:guanine deaminase